MAASPTIRRLQRSAAPERTIDRRPIRRFVGAVVATLALAAYWSPVPGAADVVPAGTLDASFDADGKTVTPVGTGLDEARAVAVQADGRIVSAGTADTATTRQFAVVRHNADGSLDTTFDGDGKVTTAIGTARDEGFAIALQPDGKMVVAGESWVETAPHFALARYNTDGSLDTTFDGDGKVMTATGVRDSARAVAVQADGKIVVAGASSPVSSEGFVTLARYNTDGSLDTTFNDDHEWGVDGSVVTVLGASSSAHAVAIDGTGNIVVAGRMSGGPSNDVVVLRYEPSGALDATFGPVGTTRAGVVITDIAGSNDVGTSLDLLADGKIVVAGFAQVASSFQMAALRYNGNGSLDSGFGGDGIVNTAVGGSSQGFGVAVDPHGRVVVAGDTLTATERDLALVRYDSDGVLDATFGTGGVVTTPVGTAADQARGLALQGDGRIVVAGFSDGGASANDFVAVRYHGDPPPAPTVTSVDPADAATNVALDVTPSATFDSVLDSFTLEVTKPNGRPVDGVTTCDSPCTTVTFTATRKLPGRTTLTATATGTTAGGTALQTWTFTTKANGGKPT